jgi:SpoVK/Ycf46/Vps4 family AAA+-type ATPase
MLALHLEGRPVARDLQIESVAEALQGYSASDIRFLVDEAARAALKDRQDIGRESFHRWGIQASVTTDIEAAYEPWNRGPDKP